MASRFAPVAGRQLAAGLRAARPAVGCWRLSSTAKDSSQVWDEQVQTFHGGQDWAHLSNFVEDFSVTTNALGTPARALERAREAVSTIHHYPPADFEPAISDLAGWLWPEGGSALAGGRGRLLLGNGASELIDLVIRDRYVPEGSQGSQGAGERLWKPGSPNGLQYKEYERSARAAGFEIVPHDHPHASVTCVINPNNPTGEYFPIVELKAMIEATCSPGSHVIVDESMQPWVGPAWREDSLLQQQGWVTEMLEKRGVHVFIMHSWTKIWSCTGVRIGSVVAPTVEVAQRIKGRQVPWSVNTMALEFLSEVVKDDEYMQRTWELTPQWRQQTAEAITTRFPSWTIRGQPFLSWLWCDTGDESTALEAVRLAKAAGTPVRHGKQGYDMPTMVRVAVREPKNLQTLLAAWEPLRATGP